LPLHFWWRLSRRWRWRGSSWIIYRAPERAYRKNASRDVKKNQDVQKQYRQADAIEERDANIVPRQNRFDQEERERPDNTVEIRVN
jgi:hypothetical protein